jgi:hypothetical protein
MVWPHVTVAVADDCTELALPALAVAVFAYAPQLDDDVALVTCTSAVPPENKFPKLHPNVPFTIEHVPGPVYAGLILQAIPVPVGSKSFNEADAAVVVPVLLTVSV